MKIEKPIFIVGHARGGSTILGSIINWHSHVGPKHFNQEDYNDINDFLTRILDFNNHLNYSEKLEQKDLWFNYFKGKDVFTHMGKEIIEEKVDISTFNVSEFKVGLLNDLCESDKRFLSKAPTNSFRIKVIKELFPDAKIVALYRNGEEVISSWGQRSYGFGKRVSWGECKTNNLSYYKGIKIFTKKWLEVIEYIEHCRMDTDILTVSYDQLVDSPSNSLERVLNYLELPLEDYIYEVKLSDNRRKWQNAVPLIYRPYLMALTYKGNKKIFDSTR